MTRYFGLKICLRCPLSYIILYSLKHCHQHHALIRCLKTRMNLSVSIVRFIHAEANYVPDKFDVVLNTKYMVYTLPQRALFLAEIR